MKKSSSQLNQLMKLCENLLQIQLHKRKSHVKKTTNPDPNLSIVNAIAERADEFIEHNENRKPNPTLLSKNNFCSFIEREISK